MHAFKQTFIMAAFVSVGLLCSTYCVLSVQGRILTDMDYVLASGKYQGDIALPRFRNAVTNRQWTNGTVPYTMTGYSAKDEAIIEHGLQWLQYMVNKASPGCLRFKPRANEEYYLKIHQGDGCWSYVGMQTYRGGQKLSLDSPGCVSKNTVMHEVIHALGFHHEQGTPDRDEHITINRDNIYPNKWFNFELWTSTSTQGMPYNYRSLMHYNAYAFSKNGKPTMTSKPAGEVLGPGVLQPMDVERIRMLYKCKPYKSDKDDIGMIKSANTQQPGDDYKRMYADNEGVCKEACMSENACLAATYNTIYKRCNLHNVLKDVVANISCSYFRKLNAAKNCKMEKRMDTQQIGPDMAVGNALNADQCGEICSVDEECTGVTFNIGNKRCYYHNESKPTNSNSNTVYIHKQC
ncbi:astacin-like metalloprotease toxin 1 [Tubulanus polymorphus]|uniref:astacin-like metalloprotease toxin 1 n=1 Tax=Tubulanus polymorphus TaxID=672921 RepID=UPI003DA2B156